MKSTKKNKKKADWKDNAILQEFLSSLIIGYMVVFIILMLFFIFLVLYGFLQFIIDILQKYDVITPLYLGFVIFFFIPALFGQFVILLDKLGWLK